MRQMNINKGNYEVKSHYKMYKAGKRWVVAGMATVSLLGGLLMLSTDASADNVDAVVPASESSVTTEVSTPTDSVVLDHASASVAPTSSVSAEVSASSASSVAPVSVSTAASVVSETASLSASQSLASSFVVPADAKMVQDDVDSDGNRRLAFVLAESADAEQDATTDTQAPDSAVTPVQTNAAYTSSTEAKSASLPAVSTSGTIAASSYIKTDSAQNHTSFSYSGSAQINDYFNQTGDVKNLSGLPSKSSAVAEAAGKILTNGSDRAHWIQQQVAIASDKSGAAFTSSMADSVAKSADANYTVYGKGYASQLSSAIAEANKQNDLKLANVSTDWKALTPQYTNEAGTLSYQSQLDLAKGFQLKGGYRIATIKNGVWSPGVGGQAVGVVMAPVQPTVMGTANATSNGSMNNNDAITYINGAVIAGRDLFVNNAGDVNSKLVHIRQTDDSGWLYGSANSSKELATAGKQSSGYVWSTPGSGTTVTAQTTDGTTLSSDTSDAVSGVLYNGVYFIYTWSNPVVDGSKVTGTLTYTEYSDAAMTTELGTVFTTVTVDRYMAVGLYGANGGNGDTFFGGISYFQGTNATTDVKVSYKFGKNDDTLLPDTKINAVVGENIKITDGKTTLSADTGMSVTYVAPDVPGFKIDPSSTMSAIAGSNDLTIKYVVDQDDFAQQVTNANTSLGDIDKSITVVQKMIDADSSSIDVQSVLTKMQGIRQQAVDKIAFLQTIADGSVDLTVVKDVQGALKKIMQGANDVSALATDASNQIDLAKEITKNAVKINKNISDDTAVMTAKDKINDDIASGQAAEDIVNDKDDLENKVGIATQNRKNAIADADKAIADNKVTNALVDGAKSALQVLTGESTPTDDTHTKTEIKAGIDNLTKVSTVDVPANVMDLQDIKDAIANLTDLLTNKPTDTPTIDAALQALKDKIDQAKLAVVEAVKDAQAVVDTALPTNVADQGMADSKYAKDMKALQDKLADKDARR
ncbi:KxYKxGKxW signal peptide domain-containing protein [Weissella confusa]